MRRMLERCAALDVHQKTVTACARILIAGGELEERIVEFSTMAGDLLALRDWLKQLDVTHVAMEATGVYWKPVYYALEDDFELLLVNAAHVKNVPGRKTNTLDARNGSANCSSAGCSEPASCRPSRSASFAT
jgi:transposase